MEDFAIVLLISRCLKILFIRSVVLKIGFCLEVYCSFLFSVSNERQRSVMM